MADKKPGQKVTVKNTPTEKHVEHEKNGVPQLETVEPTDNSQSERKEVSADAPITNPESGSFTPHDFQVADNEGKTPETQQKETQEGLQEQLNRKPENDNRR